MADEGREQAEALTGSAKKAGNLAAKPVKKVAGNLARRGTKKAFGTKTTTVATKAAMSNPYVAAVVVGLIAILLLFAVLPAGSTGIMSNENTNVYLDISQSPPEIGTDEWKEDMYEKEEAKQTATEYTEMIDEEIEKSYSQVEDEAKNVAFENAWDAKETIAHLRREDDEAVVSDSFDGEEASDGGNTASDSDQKKQQKVVKAAESYVGWEYYKVNTCSGLTARAYKAIGVTIPWMYCMGQYRTINHGAMRVSLKDAQPGDLVFYDLPDRGVKTWNGDTGTWPDHVGVIIKKNKKSYQLVHSIHSGTKKQTFADNDKYWRVKACVRIIGTDYEKNSKTKSEAAYHSSKTSVNKVNKAYESKAGSTGTTGSGKVKKVWDISKEKGGNRSTFTYMNYRAVTATGSAQYALLNSKKAYTDSHGFRRIQAGSKKDDKADAYCVALGSYFGSKIGNKYRITFTYVGGESVQLVCVLGDQKANKDTDSKNRYHTVDGSWVEFVMGTNGDNPAYRSGSPIAVRNGKPPKATKIELVEGSFTNGTGGEGGEVETIDKNALKVLSAYSVSINNMEIKRIKWMKRLPKGKKVPRYKFVDGKGNKIKIAKKNSGKDLDFKKDIKKKIKAFIKASEKGETYLAVEKKDSSDNSSKGTEKQDVYDAKDWESLGTVHVTYYCPQCNDPKGSYQSKSGKKLAEGDAACNWLPLGTKVKIKSKVYTIVDTCGTNAIDLFRDTPNGCTCSKAGAFDTKGYKLKKGAKAKKTTVKATKTNGEKIAEYAKGFAGKLPYIRGGISLKTGADCSGFVMAVYMKFGYTLPRVTYDQVKKGKEVNGIKNAEPGDLVFYHNNGHVAIYIGNGKVVHASSPGVGTIITKADYSTPCAIRRIADSKKKQLTSTTAASYDSDVKYVEKKIPYPAFFEINWDMENGRKKTNTITQTVRKQTHHGRRSVIEEVEEVVRFGSAAVQKRDISEICMPMFGVDPSMPYNESSGEINKSKFTNSDVIDQMTENTLKLYYDGETSTTTSGDLETIGSNPKGKLAWPCTGKTISSPYGWRICPFHGRELHSGTDIAAPGGSPIYAAADGKVVKTSYGSSRGYYVVIKHSNSIKTLYQHIQQGGILVKKGQKVKKGDKIAKVGSTGSSTGNHLHFEVFIKGKTTNPMQFYKKSQYN